MYNLLSKITSETSSESFYISRPELFLQEYEELISAFRKEYENTEIAYSFKTNYLPEFVNIVKSKKGYAEVVSSMELELALKMGFDPKKIFFNGPFKHFEASSKLLESGGLVNIDSIDEIVNIHNFSKKNNIKCRIGIRLNFDLKEYPSRFGIDCYRDLKLIINLLDSNPNLILESLHYHYASRDLVSWEVCMNAFLKFLNTLDNKIINDIRYISLGGGMYSRMDDEIKAQIKSKIPDFSEYAYVSAKKLKNHFQKSSINFDNIKLIIEPGTALASKALDFVTQVVGIKKIRGKYIINTTGSKYNMNPSPNRINSPNQTFLNLATKQFKINKGFLCGYTCIESDIIHNNYNGRVSLGSFIMFKEIGSYSLVMKPPFILPDVPIVEIDKKHNSYKLVRKKQSFMDVFSNYRNNELK
jgi:diaminopimelate decarboxylase